MVNIWNLNCGAKLVVEDIPYLKSAAMGVYIKVGSRNESADIAGASHFVEHMLFKGTEQRTARQIAEGFEGMGGQLNAFTAKEYTCVYARTLDEDIQDAMDIIFDMLFNSQFASRELDTEKEVVIEEINMYEDTPDELIHDIYAQKFWEGHPMGSPILGTLDSINGMSRESLYEYYKTNYVPDNMVISVAGNVDGNKIKEYIEEKLMQYKAEAPVFEKQVPQTNDAFITLYPKEIEQVQICIGVPGIDYHNDERYTQTILNSILGGGMSSRLFQTLREQMGLAYSVYSSPASYSDTGLYSIYIGTGPSKVGKFCEALYEQLALIQKDGVSSEEISRTQKLMKSSIFLGLESVMNRMSRLGKSVLMYDKVVAPEQVIEKIYKVDGEMVKNYASKLLKSERFSMAAIGDKEVLPVLEKEFTKYWGKR